MDTKSGNERYREHTVWETLDLKLDALDAARYDDLEVEQWRIDVVEWLKEARKSKTAQQPALYLSALEELSNPLNNLQADQAKFTQYVGLKAHTSSSPTVNKLESALRKLPLPSAKALTKTFEEQLDREIEFRKQRLSSLESKIADTEKGLETSREEFDQLRSDIERIRAEVQAQRDAIQSVSDSARETIQEEWDSELRSWHQDRKEADSKRDSEAVQHIGALAAAADSGRALLDYAVGELSSTEWTQRATRERKSARWLRLMAFGAFGIATLIGLYIVFEVIQNAFELTLGDAVLRAAIPLVIGALGALMLRESGRHFREADAAEDVSLSLTALAPFYENTDDGIRLAARVEVGDAVLVKNILSRFASRDASRHASNAPTAKPSEILEAATEALRLNREDKDDRQESP